MPFPESLLKPLLALLASFVLYVADAAAGAVTQAPNWIQSLGLPTAMLLLAIVGGVGLFRSLSAEREARIQDRDRFQQALADQVAKAIEAREQLISATHEQTETFRRLCGILEKKPCLAAPDRERLDY